LQQLENAHINEGGEIERRCRFREYDIKLPDGTFGLQETSAGLVVFGSIDAPAPLPSGITYLQAKHPYVSIGGTHVADSGHVMQSVLCSTQFGGKAWAAIKFVDGSVFLYYDQDQFDGVIDVIPQSYYGQVLRVEGSNAEIAARFYADCANELDVVAAYKVSYSPGDAFVDFQAKQPMAFSIAGSTTSAGGTVVASKTSDGVDGSMAIAAYCAFRVTTVGVGDQITSAMYATDVLFSTPINIPLLISPAALATQIAAQINAEAANNRSAKADGDVVTIYGAYQEGEAVNYIYSGTYADVVYTNANRTVLTALAVTNNALLKVGVTTTKVESQVPLQKQQGTSTGYLAQTDFVEVWVGGGTPPYSFERLLRHRPVLFGSVSM
jgi:hypothetical protein